MEKMTKTEQICDFLVRYLFITILAVLLFGLILLVGDIFKETFGQKTYTTSQVIDLLYNINEPGLPAEYYRDVIEETTRQLMLTELR